MFRPIPLNPGYATTIKGLYLCGSGTHPGESKERGSGERRVELHGMCLLPLSPPLTGGGVMGSPGRLAATAVLEDM